MRVEGKTAIVTGAGSGFGAGIAQTLAREGAAVIVNDVNADGGNRVASQINDAGGRALFVRADVTSAREVQDMVDRAADAFGGLDILVNNAGVSRKRKPMLDVTEDELDRILAVNVKGLFHTANAVIPVIRGGSNNGNKSGGAIINIASTGAVRPRPASPGTTPRKARSPRSPSRWRSNWPTTRSGSTP